jgi:CRP/FNR family cyclic AMP-dependent transcriptional regulator
LRSITPSQIEKIPLLSGISVELVESLVRVMQVHDVPKREFVFHKGGSGDALLFLLEGRLLVIDITDDGRQVGLNFLVPGSFFGEIALIDDLPRSASVQAVVASQVAVLPKQHARNLLFNNPLVAERMLRHLAFSLRATTDFRTLLGVPNAIQRVIMLLQMIARPDPGKLLTIENMPTHEQIALMVNTSRETVTRALHILFEQGVVEKDNRRLIVRNLEQMQAIIRQLSSEHATAD